MATYKKAKLLHIFTSADYTNKETQEVTLGKVKLQLLEIVTLRNGEIKAARVTIPASRNNFPTSPILRKFSVRSCILNYYGI